jgi:hypothetical protein
MNTRLEIFIEILHKALLDLQSLVTTLDLTDYGDLEQAICLYNLKGEIIESFIEFFDCYHMNQDGEESYLIAMQQLKSLLVSTKRTSKKLDKLQDIISIENEDEEDE